MRTSSPAPAGRWWSIVAVAGVLLAMLMSGLMFALTPGAAWSASEEKVVICHRTNSPTNPYNQIVVARSAAVNGHADHTGPVFEPGAEEWGDIVPPIRPGLPRGLNWGAGQDILDNGCEVEPDVGPLPEAVIGDVECTGTTPGVEVTVSNDAGATQPAFFALVVDDDVVQRVGPVAPGATETVVLDVPEALEDQTVTVEVRSGGEVVTSRVVTVDCVGPEPETEVTAQLECQGGETPTGTITLANNGTAPVEVAATVDGRPVGGTVTVAAGETDTATADLSAYEDQTVVVAVLVDGDEVASYTVTPDCVPPEPAARVGVGATECPPPLVTVTLANDGDPGSTVVYGVRVDGELVRESAPIYGGDETTIVADISAYEDRSAVVALVVNGEVVGRRVVRVDCEQPPPGTGPATGPDTDSPVPTVIPSGAPPPDPLPLVPALGGAGLVLFLAVLHRATRVRIPSARR